MSLPMSMTHPTAAARRGHRPSRWLVGVAATLVLVLALAGCAAPREAPGGTVTAPATATPAASATAARPEPSASPSASPTASATPTLPPPGTRPPLGTAPGTPSATQPSTASPAPTTPGVVAPFTVEVVPARVAPGETLIVRVTGPTEGVVRTAAGNSVPLLPDSGGSWAVVGIGLYATYGPATLSVSARDAQGRPIPGVATASYTVVDPGRPVDYLQVTEETASILTPNAAATENSMRGQQFSSFDAMPRWSGAFRYPIATFEVSTIFGSGRSINGGPIGEFHTGEDLAADSGAPVVAPAAGRVSWVGTMPIRGNAVIIDHGAGVLTGYHHLLDITARVGQTVEAGTLIGHVGATGFATGPHLHWELTVYGINVDPATWTTRRFPR